MNELAQWTAADVMQTTLHWAEPTESLAVAGRRMAEHSVRALLVAGDQPTDLPGILTSKDIVNVIGTQSVAALNELQVRDVMTRPALCVPSAVGLLDCLNLLRLAGVRRMPVLEGTQVVGVLSMTDVFARVLAD